MIKNKSLFILGAGSNCVYGFPTGIQLRDEIINSFNDDYRKVYYPTHTNDDQIKKVKDFTEAFHLSQTPSIDLFLDRRKEFAYIGKVSIVLRILRAEGRADFPTPETDSRKSGIYSYLFNEIFSNIKNKEDLENIAEVAFITFNYDRSLENSFYLGLKHSFCLDDQTILKVLSKIPILHVYGSIAKLQWQNFQTTVDYGIQNLPYHAIDSCSKNLYLMGERKEIDKTEIKKVILNSSNIFFLGFGYDEANLSVLGFPEIYNPELNYYGTAYKATDAEIASIKYRIGGSKIKNYDSFLIKNIDCPTLLREYLPKKPGE